MNNSIKLVVTDIDGTLCEINGELNNKTIATVKKMIDKGIKVVIATGRMYIATRHIIESLGIDTPVICYQGAMIRDKNTIYFEQNIPKNTVIAIIKKLRSYDTHINLYLKDRLIVENDDKYIKAYAGDRDIPYEVVDDLTIVAEDATKLLAINDDADLVTKIRDDFKQIYPNLNIVKSTETYCEFVNQNADKGLAIEFLANRWGLKKEEILAIGDQDNDIRMIEVAGIGVAMGNGNDNIKKAANYTCPTVQELGFIATMEKFVL